MSLRAAARAAVPLAALATAAALLLPTGCAGPAYDPPQHTSDTLTSEWQIPPFRWYVRLDRWDAEDALLPGARWSSSLEAVVDLTAHDERYGAFTELIVAVAAELEFDADGRYLSGNGSDAISTNLTPTGVPIESFGGWPKLAALHGRDGHLLEGVATFPLDAGGVAALHRLEGTLTVEVAADAPAGHYRPRAYLFARVDGVEQPVHLAAFADNWNEAPYPTLPLVRVGSPATPRLPWTLLTDARQMGRTGALSREDADSMALVGRAGFPSALIVPPATYTLRPFLPTVFPQASIAAVDGGEAVIPEALDLFFDDHSGSARCTVVHPSGQVDQLGEKPFAGSDLQGLEVGDGGFPVDMNRTGHYQVILTGELYDLDRRRYEGGGTYDVHVALPLTFSTSCKPGTSFLVGDGYPPKVNLAPPFPAEVTVEVTYLPDSDPERARHWSVTGTANRFGHFVPVGVESLVFDEPGEYASRVTARYVDRNGRLWMGEQTSAGVIAPVEPEGIRLHGTRSFPYGLRPGDDYHGGHAVFRDRQDMKSSFLPYTPAMLPDPYVPYDPRDTLFVPTHAFHESLVEPHFSMAVDDPLLAEELIDAYAAPSFLVPPMYQPSRGAWIYLRDVLQLSTDSGGWFPADRAHADELPVMPVGGEDGLHPFAFPQRARFEAYTYMGVVRPGFPAMTSVYQRDAIGLYWLTSPNRYGFHFNTGSNGDLVGDVYRVQAGAVLRDRTTGENHYDAYSAAIAVVPPDGAALSVRPPGERPVVSFGDQQHVLSLALDPHDAIEVGERIGLGGMVFPAVPADIRWTVTSPSGQRAEYTGRANRLGIVRAGSIPTDEPGLYRVRVEAEYGELTGGVVGTRDGGWWHCAVAPDAPALLDVAMQPMTRVDPATGVGIPLRWPSDVDDVVLHWGVIMPGQVLDQGTVHPVRADWTYRYEPLQVAVQFPNVDVRDFGTGALELADTVVFQFVLEGTRDGERVVDALRLVLRDDQLVNYRALLARPPGAHGTAGGPRPAAAAAAGPTHPGP